MARPRRCCSPRCVGIALLLGAATAARAGESYRWGNVPIFGGGFVSGIVAHPTAKGLMYCRTDIGGAYRWDGDASGTSGRWTAITDWVDGDHWNYTGIEALAVDPNDAGRVYLAVGTYTQSWAGNGAILRSADRGATWQTTPLPFKNGGNEDGRNCGERLAVDPLDGNVLFLGTRNDGLWTSRDRGATWSKVESFPIKGKVGKVGLTFVTFNAVDGVVGSPTRSIYVGASGSDPTLFRTEDGGATWRAVAGGPTGMIPNHGAVEPGGAGLVVTYGNAPGPNGMTMGGVWRLDVKAGGWREISPVRTSKSDAFGYSGVSFDGKVGGTMVVSTMDRWAHGDAVFRSGDGGKTWASLMDGAAFEHETAPYTAASKPHWTGDVEIDPFDPAHVLFVTGYGVWATRNAGSGPARWTFDDRGLEECVVNEVVSPPEGALALCGMWDLNGFRHTSLTESPAGGHFEPWGRCTSIDFAQHRPAVVARAYGGDATHGAYSPDNGVTWKAFGSSPPGKGDGRIAVSADGSAFLWAPEGQSAYVSRDQGNTWMASRGLPKKVTVIADRESAAGFYARDPSTGSLYASVDGGASFAPLSAGLPKGDADVRAELGRAGTFWLAAESGVYVVEGGSARKLPGIDGAHKVGFGKGLTDRPAVYVVGKVSGTYGFYRSDDSGASWKRINDDAHQFGAINSITGDPRVFGRVYLGSSNRGVIYGEPTTDSKTTDGR